MRRTGTFTGALQNTVVVLLLVFLQKTGHAQTLPITYLRIENGLSNNSVRCIYQDHDGFMWFGTYDGLNRYDGYGFKVYRNNLNDTNSLPHNYIYAINEDHHNNIWVGTGQGLGIYNKRTAKFSRAFYYSYWTKRRQKINQNISQIKTDSAGNVFIGSNGGGLFMMKESSGVISQLSSERAGRRVGDYNVQAILIDKKNRTWLNIQGVGLCRYDYKEDKIVVVNNTIKFASCFESDGDNLWIGNSDGLYKYNIASNAVTQYYREQAGQLSSHIVITLTIDQQKKLWIGTEGGGINILDPVTGKFDYLLPGEEKNTLSSESSFDF